MKDLIKKELLQARDLISEFIERTDCISGIEEAAILMAGSLKNGGKIMICGNGGSMCDAMHFAEELTGRYRENRKPIPALAISDPSHLSCVSNDFGYENVFSRYVEALGNKGDTLIVISSSGNSENIVNALTTAKEKGLFTVALTGKGAGKVLNMPDVLIDVPYTGYADRIQEVHIKVIHILVYLIEKLYC